MLYSICECEVKLAFIVNNISAAKNAFGRFLFCMVLKMENIVLKSIAEAGELSIANFQQKIMCGFKNNIFHF
jgi:hypothetical protein